MRYFVTIIIIIITSVCYSQTNNLQVVSSSGSHFVGSKAQVSFSIGEPIIFTGSSNTNKLTQGFHQPNLKVEEIPLEVSVDCDINVYPNPVIQNLTIDLGEFYCIYYIVVYDAIGRLVMSKETSVVSKANFDFTVLSAGVYFLKMQDVNSDVVKIFKIQKL